MDLETIASRFGWSDEEVRARNSICEIGKICYQRGLISASDGNISVRLADDTVVITPAGGMKGFLQLEQLARLCHRQLYKLDNRHPTNHTRGKRVGRSCLLLSRRRWKHGARI